MNKQMEEALVQAVTMHFRAFQEFMGLTGNDIGMSLKLSSSFTAGIMQSGNTNEEGNADKEKGKKLFDVINGNSGMTS